MEEQQNQNPEPTKPSLTSLIRSRAGSARARVQDAAQNVVNRGKSYLHNVLTQKTPQVAASKKRLNTSSVITSENNTSVNNVQNTNSTSNKNSNVEVSSKKQIDILTKNTEILQKINQRILKWYDEWRNPKKIKTSTLKSKLQDLKDRAKEKIQKQGKKIKKMFGFGGGSNQTNAINASEQSGGGVEDKASKAKELNNLATNQGFFRTMIPRIFSAIGSSIGAIIPLLLKAVMILVVVAAAAGLGFLLYKHFIEPWMDKEQAKRDRALAKTTKAASMAKENIVTDTGEKVFERKDTKTGAIKYVTEKEMQSELEKMTPEQQKEVKSGTGPISFREAQNTIDLKSGMYSGLKLQSGKPIEQINIAADEYEKFSASAPPRQKAQRDFARRIVQFDQSFRTRFKELSAAWLQTHGPEDGTGQLAGDKSFTHALEGLQSEQQTILDALRRNTSLTEEDKNELIKLSGLFKGGLWGNPSVSGYTIYNLPSNQKLNLNYEKLKKVLGKNSPILGKHIDEIGISKRAEAIKQQHSAEEAIQKIQTKTEQSSSPTPGTETVAPSATSTNTNSTTSTKVSTPSTLKIQPTEMNLGTQVIPQPSITTAIPQTQLSGDNLQKQTMNYQQSMTPTIVNNYYTTESKPNNQTVSISGGSGGSSSGAAVPPDDSGMHSMLTRDAGRAASMGTHT